MIIKEVLVMAEKEIKRADLSKYNGQNGNPAYVAVKGVVYDVTNSPAWSGGKHHGNLAGTDVTDALYNKSPHGDRVLAKLPVVGKLVD